MHCFHFLKMNVMSVVGEWWWWWGVRVSQEPISGILSQCTRNTAPLRNPYLFFFSLPLLLSSPRNPLGYKKKAKDGPDSVTTTKTFQMYTLVTFSDSGKPHSIIGVSLFQRQCKRRRLFEVCFEVALYLDSVKGEFQGEFLCT